MKVKILKTTPGSIDGIHVENYKKDEVYELEGSLLDVFFKMKVAEPVTEVKMVEVTSNKAVKPEVNKEVEEEDKEDKKKGKK